ncbi:unnamed protein product [Gulo gulo]|uniref:Uncharacterized protein n=1 Tax=Gulo gulo TaxID=48420 RepID=A0A9X9MDS9_GULGU|nr:unnamed protein product [Gulo gulo]
MSVRRGQRPARPATRLSWLLCCSALLSPAAGYVIVSSVSWAVTNEVDEELDSASTEEALPALLPGLRAQGGRAPAAPARRRPRQAAPSAARDVLLPARERPEAASRHRPLPGPRQRLGLSGHRVRPREDPRTAVWKLPAHQRRSLEQQHWDSFLLCDTQGPCSGRSDEEPHGFPPAARIRRRVLQD